MDNVEQSSATPPTAVKPADKENVSDDDSVTTSGEYEIVPEPETPQLNLPKDTLTTPTNIVKKTIPLSPILNIAGDMKEMEMNLTEVIKELDVDEKDGEFRIKK